MLFVDKPYISDFLKKTIADNSLPVVNTGVVKSLDLYSQSNLITESQAITTAKKSKTPLSYSTSENAIGWISKNLSFTNLPQQIDLFKDNEGSILIICKSSLSWDDDTNTDPLGAVIWLPPVYVQVTAPEVSVPILFANIQKIWFSIDRAIVVAWANPDNTRLEGWHMICAPKRDRLLAASGNIWSKQINIPTEIPWTAKIKNGSFPLPEREFLNINIPADVKNAEIRVTYAGYRYYANDSHLHRNPRGEEYYWLGLHPLNFKARAGVEGMSDHEAIEEGFISITPIQLDLSAYKSMNKLKEWLWNISD